MNEQGFVLTFEHVPTTPLIPERLSTYAGLISEVIAKKSGPYVKGEDALRLPQDPSVLLDVTHMVQRYWNTQLRYVIVVGVGGSNLGAKAVYDALRGTLDGYLDGFPKLIFLDTVSPKLLGDLERLLEVDVSYKEEIVLNLISKSGSTTESVANFEMLHAYLLKRFPTINDRIVVTTEKDSPLWNIAEKHKFGVLLHQHVGGRFSAILESGESFSVVTTMRSLMLKKRLKKYAYSISKFTTLSVVEPDLLMRFTTISSLYETSTSSRRSRSSSSFGETVSRKMSLGNPSRSPSSVPRSAS